MKSWDYDECFCGDYRHQHKDGTGPCLLGKLCIPSPCQEFVLARVSEMADNPSEER